MTTYDVVRLRLAGVSRARSGDAYRTRGRHRLGAPGLSRRPARSSRRPARHRATCVAPSRPVRAETASLVAVLITVALMLVGGWYAASGASAVAQMLAR